MTLTRIEPAQATQQEIKVLPPEPLPRPEDEVPPPKPARVPRPGPQSEAVQPETLIGHGPDRVTDLLGTPAEVREEPPATVWVYNHGECKLEVFFYMDMESESLRSLAIDVKGGVASEATKQACLARFLSQPEQSG